MKRGLLLVSLFVLFCISADAQSDTVIFNGTISELVIKTGANTNVLNLSDYFSSNNTVEYKYKTGSDGIDGLLIEIKEDSRVNIEANNPGSRSVIFIADDDINAVESNEVNIKISGTPIITTSFSPNSDTVSLNENDEQTFAVSGNGSVEWHLDNVKLNHTSSTYSFSNSTVGVHTLRAVSGSETKTWTISVLAESIVAPVISNTTTEDTDDSAECGNSIREQGEDCSNCASDVLCSANSECLNGICVPKKTGINFNLVLWLGLLAIAIAGIVVGVVLIKKKKAGKELDMSEKINPTKKSILEKVKNLFKKKNPAELEEKKPAEEKSEKIEEIDLNPLMMYFKTNLNKYKKEDLIKQALQQGWNQEQIDKALAGLELGNSGDGNDNTDENKGIA